MVPQVNFMQQNKQQKKEKEEVDQKQIIFSVYWSNTGFLIHWCDGNRQNSLSSRHESLEWASSTHFSDWPIPVTQQLRGDFLDSLKSEKSEHTTYINC